MLIDFRQLFPRWGIHPRGVLHLGANIGEEAPVYKELGIEFGIFMEANVDLHQKLRSNLLKAQPKGRYVPLLYCVSDEYKQTFLNISNNGGQSSSLLELGTHKIQHPDVHYIDKHRVSTVRIDGVWPHIKELMQKSIEGNSWMDDLDFLNIDIQGAELKALKGMGDLLHQFKWAYIEVNKAQVYEGCPHVNDLDLFLNGFGFKRVETAHWIGDWTDALYIKKQFI